MGRLEGRVAVVTGAANGIGAAVAKTFAAEGAVVVVNDVDRDRAEVTADACRALGVEALVIAVDVSDSAAVNAMLATVAERFGRLDVLVNNAGIVSVSYRTDVPGTVIAEISDDDWHRMLGIHLDGNFFCTRAAVPIMAANGGGSIVCMSSTAALSGTGSLPYAAAKAGILGLVRSLARDAAAAGIRVNAICPGIIKSDGPMWEAVDQEQIQRFGKLAPMGRLGTPQEVAWAAVYLASDESSFTTGQWLSPNGGMVIC